MNQDNKKGFNLLLFCGIFISFIAIILAGMLNKSTGTSLEGLLLTIVGTVCIISSKNLAEAQRDLAEKPFIPSYWQNARPLTFVLWGIGVALLGIIRLLRM